jgi:hypothetical protein
MQLVKRHGRLQLKVSCNKFDLVSAEQTAEREPLRIACSDASPALRLKRSWSQREAMAAHDLRHLCSVQQTTGVLDSVVAETVNVASRNAYRLPNSMYTWWLEGPCGEAIAD